MSKAHDTVYFYNHNCDIIIKGPKEKDKVNICVRKGLQLATSGHQYLHSFASRIIVQGEPAKIFQILGPKQLNQILMKSIHKNKKLDNGSVQTEIDKQLQLFVGWISAEYLEVFPTQGPHRFQ